MIEEVNYEELVNEDQETLVKSNWKNTLWKGKGGVVVSCIENYIKYLENDAKYKDKMWYNEFTNKKELNGKPFADDDYSIIYRNIEKDLGVLNRTCVDDAIKVVYSTHCYDPVKDYVKSLEWDGVKRIETLFIDLLEADDTELNRYMTKKWMIAGIKRVLHPGCKFDNILILTGAQGTGKSTICERLARGYYNYFSFDEISSENKDAKIRLNSSWIAIFDELDSLSKKDQTTVKTFLSMTEDTVRKPYGREDVTMQRRCVFIGSTNESKMLNDDTGNRRFWVIDCKKTSRDSRVFNTMTPDYVDQLWAEAYHCFKENPNQYLDIPYELQETFNKEQEQFNDIYNDAAASYLDSFLDKRFDINSDGEVYDYDDLRSQNENGHQINKIPVYIISELLTDHRYPFKNIKRVAAGLRDWEYKNCKYKKLGQKTVLSLVRRTKIYQKKKSSDPMDAFKHLETMSFEGLNL